MDPRVQRRFWAVATFAALATVCSAAKAQPGNRFNGRPQILEGEDDTKSTLLVPAPPRPLAFAPNDPEKDNWTGRKVIARIFDVNYPKGSIEYGLFCDPGFVNPLLTVVDDSKLFGGEPALHISVQCAGHEKFAVRKSDALLVDNAIPYIDERLKTEPKDAVAIRLRALIYADQGSDEKALTDYDAAIALSPEPAYFVERGLLLARMNKSSQGLKDIESALALRKDFGAAYAARGQLHFENNADDLAMRDLNTALDLKYKTSNVYLLLVILSARQNRIVDPMRSFDEVISVAVTPEEKCAAALECGAFLESHDYNGREKEDITKAFDLRRDPAPQARLPKSADAEFRRASQLVPEKSKATYFEDRAFARDRNGLFDRAEDDFTESLKLKPDHIDALLGRATTRMKMHMYQGALADLEAAEKLKPDAERIPLVRAKILLDQKKIAEAAVAAAEAVKRNPLDLQAKYVRGEARNKAGDLAGAREDLDAVVAARSAYPAGVHARAEIATAQKDWLVADSDWSRVIELKQDAEAFCERAKIRAFQLGRSAEAVADAEKACVLSNNSDPKLIETLAEVYAKTGNFMAAYDAQSVACRLYSPGAAAEKLARKRLGRYLAEQPTDDIER